MDWIKKDNYGWVDVLRIVAIFAVVWSHVCDDFIAQFNNDRTQFLTGVYLESIGRPCVTLLVMVSGWLLLPVRGEYSVGGYYRKRIGRILWPLAFWSIVLPLVSYAYYVYGNPSTGNPFVDVASYTPQALGTKLYTWVFNFNVDTIPLWYLYMLIGLYLALPIVNGWLRTATRRDVGTVLILWGVSLLFPYLRLLATLAGMTSHSPLGANLWGMCDWNIFHSIYYLSGFMGYMLLAYYLKTWPPRWSWTKTLLVAVPMYLLGYCGTSFGYIWVNSMFPGQYQYLEIPWLMCGLNVMLQTVGVFLIFMRLQVKSRPWLSRMAAMMFGIYLCHFPIIQMTYDLYDVSGLPYALRIALMALTTFAASYAVTRLLWALPLTRRFVK